MASDVSPIQTPVVNATQTSSPIEISQAQLLQGDDGTTHLWVVYHNQSDGVIQRFEISAAFFAASGKSLAITRRIVRNALGAGESTTAEIPRFTVPTGAAKVTIAVTRVRFADLALWMAPPPPPSITARTNFAQTIGGRVPVTDVVQPTTGPIPAPASTSNPSPAGAAATPASNSAIAVGNRASSTTLVSGTSIDVSLATAENSATAMVGDRVEFTVVRGTSTRENVVIAVGAKGMGHVADVRRAGRFGRSGSLTFVPDVVEAANGSFVPLQGSVTIHPPPTILSILADLTILGGFVARGRDAVLSAGSVITATTATGTATNQAN